MKTPPMPETLWALCRGQHCAYFVACPEGRRRWVVAIYCDEELVKLENLPDAAAAAWYAAAVYAELLDLGFKTESEPWEGDLWDPVSAVRAVLPDPSKLVH